MVSSDNGKTLMPITVSALMGVLIYMNGLSREEEVILTTQITFYARVRSLCK
jgi:hypothetical protein